MAKDMVPIYTVQKEGFPKMVGTLDSRYELPGRNFFNDTAIPQVYRKRRREVQADIATVKYFSTTADLWSSRTSEPYISLTVHYIDDNFDLKSHCLQTSYFPGDHDGINIAAGLKEGLAAWVLSEERQVAITTDNTGNIIKAVENYNQWERVHCFGHRLHLAIENAVRSEGDRITRATGVCRKIVGHFSHSWKKRVALKTAQIEEKLPDHVLVTDCQTRWGSTQKMVERVLEQQPAIHRVLSSDRKTRHLLPSWQDLEVLESVNKALSPFQEFTDALSDENHVSISYLRPVLHLFNTSMLAEKGGDTDLTKSLKGKILNYLNTKYEESKELLNMTSFLDPRFRTQYFSMEETQTIRERVTSELMQIQQQQHRPAAQSSAAMETARLDVEPPPPAKARKKTLASFFKSSAGADAAGTSVAEFDPVVQCRESVAAELNTYIYMPCIDQEEDPLKWWKCHKINFPWLSKLAQKYLCIQATSSASERAFSTSGNVVTAHRSCLKPSKRKGRTSPSAKASYSDLMRHQAKQHTPAKLAAAVTQEKLTFCVGWGANFTQVPQPVSIDGADIEVVSSYKYLGVHLDDKLDRSCNTTAIYWKGQSRLHFLRRLGSFNVCSDMLHMFYKTVVESALLYAAVCWGGNQMDKDRRRLDKLIKRAGSVVGRGLDDVGTVVGRRMRSKVQSILANPNHPLHSTVSGQKSSRSDRLPSMPCRTECFRRSFIPSAI
ncbi:E3 SUMO-protein ligase ZBED1-like [Halichoeres trimaculatus]|uniref:E3 SUMO-protein ligase ZBED1-like n=1 Tax=Halichoeres trimaculatus TaxID=147232 RepID=UPI003D9FA188